LRRVAAVVMLILSVGCTTPAPAARRATETGTTSGPASSSAAVLPFEGEGAPLEPGRYAYEGFTGPPITFAVRSGWVGGHMIPEFFDVQREADGVLLGFADPTFVVGGEGAVDVADLTAHDAIASMASNPSFHAGSVRPGTIDGRDAFEVRGSLETSVELFGGDDGSFTAEPGSLRLLALDVDGRIMLIVVTVPEEQSPRVERAIDRVIASIRFEATP
jgi:hypothetical protein